MATARALVAATAAALAGSGLTSMVIWVARDNSPARRFYERLGGAQVGEGCNQVQGLEVVEAAYGWDDIGALAAADRVFEPV